MKQGEIPTTGIFQRLPFAFLAKCSTTLPLVLTTLPEGHQVLGIQRMQLGQQSNKAEPKLSLLVSKTFFIAKSVPVTRIAQVPLGEHR